MAGLPQELLDAVLERMATGVRDSRFSSSKVDDVNRTIGNMGRRAKGVTRRDFMRGVGDMATGGGRGRYRMEDDELAKELQYYTMKEELRRSGDWNEAEWGPLDEADPDDIFAAFGADFSGVTDIDDLISYAAELGLL